MDETQSTALLLQSYFDQFLLHKLVESGALTKQAARDVAVSSAKLAKVFAGLADEPGAFEAANFCAVNFERTASSLAN